MNRIILKPVTREYIQNLRGKYKGKSLLAALAAEKKRSLADRGEGDRSDSRNNSDRTG